MQNKNTLRFRHLQKKLTKTILYKSIAFTQALGENSGCNQRSISKEWWGTMNKKSHTGDGVYVYIYYLSHSSTLKLY